MAGKTVGNTTSKSTEGALRKTEYKFRYTATRDKYAVVIGSVIAAVILVVLCIICNAVGTPLGVITIGTIAYIAIALFVIMCNFLSIHGKTFSVLIIRKDEIVYSHGWLTKGTTTIPAHKIRSCHKCSTWLQRKCKTMDIGITTAGDGAEIYFCNIEAGEKAYKLISQMAKENTHGR